MDLDQPATIAGHGHDAYRVAMAAEQAAAVAALAGPWHVPPALADKVDGAGRLRSFFGDSVVIPVADGDRVLLEATRAELTHGLEGLFAETLPASTFHVTVHDLTHGADRAQIETELWRNREQCRKLLADLGPALSARPRPPLLRLRPMRVFPCLNLSLIVGLAPASEADFNVLANLHAAFDAVVPAATWLRPHLTLAYFRPTVPDAAMRDELAARLRIVATRPETLALDLSRLSYVEFHSMADYCTLLTVTNAGPR